MSDEPLGALDRGVSSTDRAEAPLGGGASGDLVQAPDDLAARGDTNGA